MASLGMVPSSSESKFADHTRFEIELEFVQCLANPQYLLELFLRNYLQQAEFVAYLDYLQYFKSPTYAKYLFYPGPTLRVLELLQQKSFRDRLGDSMFVDVLKVELLKASAEVRPR